MRYNNQHAERTERQQTCRGKEHSPARRSAVLHHEPLMQEMQLYLSEEDDFSELTDISSSIFCLISGKIRKYSQPRPPALAFHSLTAQATSLPYALLSGRRPQDPAPVRARPSRAEGTRREAPRRTAHMTAHGGGRNHSAGGTIPRAGRGGAPRLSGGRHGYRAGPAAAAASGRAEGSSSGGKSRNEGFMAGMSFPVRY